MRRGAFLVLIVLLAACVSAPERRQPDVSVSVPRAWTADEHSLTGTPDAAWWESFGDPQLGRLVDLALNRNQDLQAAAARLDRAAAEAEIAGADLKPSIGAGLDATVQRSNNASVPFGPAVADAVELSRFKFENYGLSLDASWEIDLWGRIRAGARAAVAEMQATEADWRGARLSIAAQTAKIWFSILEARQQAALAEESVRSFRLSADQVRSRYETGIRPALDLRLALSNLAGAEALLQLRRNQLDLAVRQLEVLLGGYPDGMILETLDAGSLPDTPQPVPAGLPSELLTRRPDLIAAERRLTAADQRYLVARRSLYPRLNLTGSGGTSSGSLSDLLDGDFRVWSLLAGLTQPVFQGGRLRAGVEAADASSHELFSYYVGSVLDAFAEVESALASERFLAERETHLAEAAEQLVAARRLAAERYRTGVGIYLVVLESQTRALTAESELLTVRRQRLDNRVDLHLALGGGFESATPASHTAERGEAS
jgi:NodT family efflux transporter outer membrane factor (OMF) lipoprotein